MIVGQVRLRASQLVAELHQVGGTDFVCLQAPGRDQLLPLRDEPICGALACFTPLGRWHALYWSLAFGRADDAGPSALHFTGDRRNGWRERSVEPIQLGDRWWLAEADGLFAGVTVWSGTSPVARAAIGPARRA